MNNDVEINELTERFRALGAADPRSWAESQVREGIPQLARFLFLRQAWRKIVSENDPQWITACIESANKQADAPYAGVGRALRRLRDRGVADDDITDLVRGMQAELLGSVCYLLEDPDIREPEGQGILWSLVQVAEDGEILEPITGLHESVLETDPTGREMRPR